MNKFIVIKFDIYKLSNLLLTIPFVMAIVNPIQNISFIYDTGIMLFIAEFIAIHSNTMLSASDEPMRKRIGILAFYVIFTSMFMLTTNSPQVFYYLLASIIIKFFTSKTGHMNNKQFATPILFLMASVFFVVIFAGPLHSLIRLPESVMLARPANANGLFIDVPQTILAWGIIYPLLLTFVDIGIKH